MVARKKILDNYSEIGGMADAPDLGSGIARCKSSTLLSRIGAYSSVWLEHIKGALAQLVRARDLKLGPLIWKLSTRTLQTERV